MRSYQLVWSDEFDYEGPPDPAKWGYELGAGGWGNDELQCYTDLLENAWVKDGCLHLQAIKTDNGYTSARLTTYGKKSWKYGRVEFRAKLPKGKGSWPALWMLPDDIHKGVPWPLCGEIDIMEHVGKDEDRIHVSLHTDLYNHVLNTQRTHFEPLENATQSYHTYAMEWTEQAIEFFYDGRSVAKFVKGENGSDITERGWPFDKPYFILMNIAVGGFWGGPVDDNRLPFVMEVDYVRVYQIMDQESP